MKDGRIDKEEGTDAWHMEEDNAIIDFMENGGGVLTGGHVRGEEGDFLNFPQNKVPCVAGIYFVNGTYKSDPMPLYQHIPYFWKVTA